MTGMDRRHLLEGIGSLIGLSALPLEALAKVSRQSPLLDRATSALVSALADTLIPNTDTPGAVQAGVPAKFDQLLRDWASAEHRTQHLAALSAIDTAAKAKRGKAFALLSPPARAQFMIAYDAENYKASAPYTSLKELLVNLYYLSELGATKELRYEHAPGKWISSIPLTKQTRAWAGANVG